MELNNFAFIIESYSDNFSPQGKKLAQIIFVVNHLFKKNVIVIRTPSGLLRKRRHIFGIGVGYV
jgi:hypothetical protein